MLEREPVECGSVMMKLFEDRNFKNEFNWWSIWKKRFRNGGQGKRDDKERVLKDGGEGVWKGRLRKRIVNSRFLVRYFAPIMKAKLKNLTKKKFIQHDQ